VVHRRTVELDGAGLHIEDEVRGEGEHEARLAFHLGPAVDVELDGATARLSWSAHGAIRTAVLDLPADLAWSAHRGETSPPLGWYSPGFGRREPAWALVGSGRVRGGDTLTTLLRFAR
jgi:hypothetical protein